MPNETIGALAVEKAAKALGVDLEEIIRDHRKDIHCRRLEESRRYEKAAGVLPSGTVPTPNSFAAPRRHSPHASMPSGSRAPLFARKPRKRAWK